MFIKLHLFDSNEEIYIRLNDVVNVLQEYNKTNIYMENGTSLFVKESAKDVVAALEEGWQKFALVIFEFKKRFGD